MNFEFFEEKNFKDTELGPLPEDWEVVRLGEVLEEVNSNMRKVKIDPQKSYKTVITRLYAKGIQLKDITSGDKIATNFMFEIRTGDFIFSKINLRKGAFDFVPRELNGAVVSSEHPILKLNKMTTNEGYIKYYLSQPSTWEVFKREAKGFSGKERVKVREFLSIYIPLPPLSEQKAIAEVLSTIQEARERTEEVIKATKELKKSMMKHLFTYGPVSLDEIDKVKLKETEIGLLPEHWEVVKLGEVCEVSSGGSAPQGDKYFGGGNFFIRVQHIDNEYNVIKGYDLITDEAVKRYKLKLYPRGTIIFPKSGATVYLEKRAKLPFDAYIVSHLCAVNTKTENLSQDFLYYTLLNIKFAEKKGDSYPTLNLSEIRQFFIPLPPLSEQQTISNILQAIDEKIQREEERKKALENLFKSMLHNLMSGRIRVKILEAEVL